MASTIPTLAHKPSTLRIWGYGVVSAVFLFLLLFTSSPFLGDTMDYVESIQSSLPCHSISKCPELWDAGHLLWRPLGYFLSPPLFPLLNRLVGPDVRMSIALLLVILSVVGLFIAAILLYAILVTSTNRPLLSLVLIVGFLCANASLEALHSGSPYSLGLACLMGSVWFLQQESQAGSTQSAAFAGVCGAAAVSFWLPYLAALPATLCWVLLDGKAKRLRRAVVLTVTTTAAGALLFGLGAHFRGVESISDFGKWLASSDHGIVQNRNLIRSLFGLPRAFLYMGEFGVKMKQFLFKDPFAHVRLAELFWLGFWWKLALFYAALFSLLGLYRRDSGRKALGLFVVALLANMAVALGFEGGSPERYFPLYPFFFIALAQCLCWTSAPRLFRAVVSLFLAVMILGNVPEFAATRVRSEEDRAARRLSPLLPLRPASYVFVLSQDGIGSLRRNSPFHHINQGAGFEITSVYMPMVTAHWKHDFATRVLSVWRDGGDVWLTTRVWAQRPEVEWGWVEGDDPNLSWNGIVDFFRSFDHGPAVGGDDGFVLLLGSARNQALLTSDANN